MTKKKPQDSKDIGNLPLTLLRGIGERRAETLAGLGIHSVIDLFDYYPTRYLDFSLKVPISDLLDHVKQNVTIEAEIRRVRKFGFGRRAGTRATLRDETGEVEAVWFNQPYLYNTLESGSTGFFSGNARNSKTYGSLSTSSGSWMVCPSLASFSTFS